MFPLPHLDESAGEALYRQLYDFIKQEIVAGRIERGERMPATRELAGLLGLNRATVNSAYELLESEGLIRTQVGKGSFVSGGLREGDPGPIPWGDRLASVPESDNPVPAIPGVEEVASFVSSRPSELEFPLEEFRDACQEVLRSKQLAEFLQLGSPLGYAPLREFLFTRALNNKVARYSDDLMVTSGCQQALDLLQRLLTKPGDTVLVEDPVYPGLKNVFAGAGVRCAGIPMTAEGLDLESLERALQRERPRLIVVTPNYQNPTGVSLPLGQRETLLRLARAARTPVVENDIYGELRYSRRGQLPTLKELDPTGDVIQIKSFSKIAFPGLRTGWVIAPRGVIARMATLKQWTDLHSDQLSQAVLHRFASTGRLQCHLERIKQAGSERLRAVIEACEQALPKGSSFTRPEGGMNLWVRLPEPLDAAALLPEAAQRGVTYLPGRYFAVSHVEHGGLRLSFAGLEPDSIREGVGLLGELFSEHLARARGTSRRDHSPAIV